MSTVTEHRELRLESITMILTREFARLLLVKSLRLPSFKLLEVIQFWCRVLAIKFSRWSLSAVYVVEFV